MTSAQLLGKAAEALVTGEDPFSEGFLARNNVTSDQCISLARNLAIGAGIVAKALRDGPASEYGIMLAFYMASEPWDAE